MILLDTCALIWLVNKDPVAPAALAAADAAYRRGEIWVSPLSAWEIGMLAARGRLKLACPAAAYVERAFRQPGVRVAELTAGIAVNSTQLPWDFHGDPVDRMLVATALEMGLRLMTRDRRLLEYGAAGHLPVVKC